MQIFSFPYNIYNSFILPIHHLQIFSSPHTIFTIVSSSPYIICKYFHLHIQYLQDFHPPHTWFANIFIFPYNINNIFNLPIHHLQIFSSQPLETTVLGIFVIIWIYCDLNDCARLSCCLVCVSKYFGLPLQHVILITDILVCKYFANMVCKYLGLQVFCKYGLQISWFANILQILCAKIWQIFWSASTTCNCYHTWNLGIACSFVWLWFIIIIGQLCSFK